MRAARASRGQRVLGQRSFECRREDSLELENGGIGRAVLDRNDFSLLGDLDPTAHGTEGLRENRTVGGPASASDRPTAPVKEFEVDAVPIRLRDERALNLFERHARGQVAAVRKD